MPMGGSHLPYVRKKIPRTGSDLDAQFSKFQTNIK
jgi:hypothetical protein